MLWTDGSGDAQLWQLNGSQVSVTTLSGGSSGSPELGEAQAPSTPQAAGQPSDSTAAPQNGFDTVIGSGDSDVVYAGDSISDPLIDGGTLQLASGAVVNGPITFAAGAGGTLLDADQALRPDTVMGFTEGSDYLTYAGATAASEAQVIASAQTSNGNTTLTFPDHTSIVLVGVTHVDTGIFAPLT
jgi:hypothetical protein